MDEVPDTRPSLLVRLCDPKDDRAWTEFTAIYSPLIYRFACRKGFQDADAADLVQEVLRGRFRRGPLGTRPVSRAVSQLAVPDRKKHDAEPRREPMPASARYRARRKSSGCSKPGLPRPRQTPRCLKRNISVNSSGGPLNVSATSFGGRRGPPSGRPESKGRKRKSSPTRSG